MTGRTHDLAAFTALNIAFILYPTSTLTLGTAATAIGANMIGGLLPDIDNATADIWDKVRGGNVLAKFIRPLIGKHRMITHSILGMAIIGYVLKAILALVGTVLLVDMNIVWWATMLGAFSHLATDSITRDGVPWLFPVPIRYGFPPFRALRMKTGGFWEKVVVFPGLIALNGYLIYTNYSTYLLLLRGFYK